ncbi:hypothetical protein Dimus_026120 [Dionaea muscipula]
MPNLDHYSYTGLQPRTAKPPSFSSILLDAIYHSIEIDDSSGQQDQISCYTTTTTTTTTLVSADEQKRNNRGSRVNYEAETLDLRKAIMMEKCNEKQQAQNNDHTARLVGQEFLSVPERNSAGSQSSVLFSSPASSSPSGSSSGSGDNTSSTTETDFSSSCFTPRIRPLKIRTSLDKRRSGDCQQHFDQETPPTKRESRSMKTKPRTSEIYGELKTAKQPISPGARIAGFLNSMFHAKKQNATVPDQRRSNTSSQSSACSSASSFPRSCLGKKPPSSGKSSANGVKRSVRFSPASLIDDDDGHKCDQKLIPTANATKSRANARRCKGDSADSRSYDGRKWRCEEEEIDLAIRAMMMRGAWSRKTAEDDSGGGSGGDMEDDAKSYASSDLFELENLSSIGITRYNEELPVYGTTNLPVW